MSSAGPEWQAATEAQRTAAQQVAIALVWSLSGRQYGVAEVLLAPWVPYAAPYYYRSRGYPWMQPFLISKWDQAKRLALPGPVAEVREVIVGGVVLTAEVDYHLDPDGHLVKTEGIWPAQNLTAPVWTCRYVRGVTVPPAAQLAAGAYAIEWLKAHTGTGKCRLPSRTREVARQGVTIQLADPESLAKSGLSGLPEVDAFLSAANPFHAAAPPSVWSPEVAAHRIISVGPA